MRIFSFSYAIYLIWRKGHNYNNRMGMIRQLNMQKRDTRECLFQAMDEKARLAALILCDTSSAVSSLDTRSLMHFQLLLSFDVSKYSVLSTFKRRLSSAKMDSHELTIVGKVVELALAACTVVSLAREWARKRRVRRALCRISLS